MIQRQDRPLLVLMLLALAVSLVQSIGFTAGWWCGC
ncbi:hypothetical protein FB471_4069 [Amycolatopsis cihanbeyliensis]|uniref:Uncharacterized protein n=1 Tax=Amycolatopsis cihanbeyliensis TaxID=1128664 RepID=A0A542DMG1_AMYCI|nr:hypothetical protein FB471_4069 [Amycolatopsis cihanbeyliensis]